MPPANRVVVKSKIKTPLVVPRSVRRMAGHKNDEDLEFRVSRGAITIRPKPSAATDDYSPRERRVISARLAKADADIKARRMSKAFSDHGEFIAALHKEAGRLAGLNGQRGAKKSTR